MTNRDFTFTRLCDDHPVGNRIDGSLEVAVTSPLGDNYAEYGDDGRCILHTSAEQGRVLIRLPDDPHLGRELQAYLQTESYVKTKHTGSLPDTTKRILRDRSEDNRGRRTRVVASLKEMLAKATYFASGNKLDIGPKDPKVALNEALEYLIKNAYPKMRFIKHLHQNPKQEIQSTLRANDVDQVSMNLNTPEANAEALDDVREYVRLCAMTSKQIVLHEMIDKRYGGRPYGWPELELVLLVARLAVLKEINLIVNSAPLPLDRAYDYLTSSSKQRKVVITERESAGGDLIKKAQALGKVLFAKQGPGAEDTLFTFLDERLSSWNTDLASYEPLAKTGNYPGRSEIENGLACLRKFVEESDSFRFLRRFVENKDELISLSDDIHDLQDFYTNQKHSWETLRAAVTELSPNRMQLESDATAGAALARMEEILRAAQPYSLVHEASGLTHTARTVNDQLVSDARGPAVAEIQGLLDGIKEELDKVGAKDALRSTASRELEKLVETTCNLKSIAHIVQARQTAEVAFDRAMTTIEEWQSPPPPLPKPDDSTPPPTPPPKVKKRRVVEAKQFWSSGFIETAADVENFLGQLRTELEAALSADERVQIK